jgi:hypothetical protein
MFRAVLPQPGAAGVFLLAGVSHIKDIANSVFAGAGVDEGNALSPPHHIPAHLLVPEVIVCTGGGLRALGVDKKLFVKWIFLKILSRGNVKFCPSLHFCNRVCSVS